MNKFPQLTTQERLVMLDIKTADIWQTRFYQEVFAEGQQEGLQAGLREGLQAGRQEGEQQGEATSLLRLERSFGPLLEGPVNPIRALSLAQLDALWDRMLWRHGCKLNPLRSKG
jgi:predicted transposase YdaD